jgi:hypothetical protein
MGRRSGSPESAGAWAAAAAAALLTFDPYQVYACAVVLPAAPLGFMLLAVVGAGLEFIEVSRQGGRACPTAGGRAWPWAALAGLAVAAVAYIDWRMVGLAPLVGLAALVAPGRRRYLAGWGIGLLVMAVALAPWLVRNEIRLGSPVLTTDLGVRLYAGSEPAAGLSAEGPRSTAEAAGHERGGAEAAPPKDLGEVGRDRFYLRSALGRMAADPGRWLEGVARNAARMWSSWPVQQGGSLLLPPVAGYTSLLPAAVLALAGVWALRRKRAELVWLLAMPVYATVAGAVFAGGVEDRLPVAPILAVLGGLGLAAIIVRPGAEQGRGPGVEGRGKANERAT